MPTIKPQSTQTLFDIAIMNYGNIVYATDIAHANGLSITDDITNLTLTLPDIELTDDDKRVLRELKQNNVQIATKFPL